MALISESVVEDAALDWFSAFGYTVVSEAEMVPSPSGWRKSYEEVVLWSSLLGSLERLTQPSAGACWRAFFAR